MDLSRPLRICGVWQTVSGFRNASGPSGPPRICGEIQPVAPHPSGVYVHVSGNASGPFECHLPDTARLRRSLRTTQETGPDWRVPFAPEKTSTNPVECIMDQICLVHHTSPQYFRHRTRGTTAKTPERGKSRGDTPQKSGENDSQEKGQTTTTRRNKPRPNTEAGAQENQGQTGRSVVSLDTVFPARDSSLWTVVGLTAESPHDRRNPILRGMGSKTELERGTLENMC